MLFKFKICMRGFDAWLQQVANIVDDWPLIKQNPGARARGKKERSSNTRYTSLSPKSMLVLYQRDADLCQRDSIAQQVRGLRHACHFSYRRTIQITARPQETERSFRI
jgi:hypothetical protein